jgi:hypothetical protein
MGCLVPPVKKPKRLFGFRKGLFGVLEIEYICNKVRTFLVRKLNHLCRCKSAEEYIHHFSFNPELFVVFRQFFVLK